MSYDQNYKKRDWLVLLIGGASGTGKSSISYPLSRLYNINLVEVDDFQEMLKGMTTPENLPAVHYWETHPNWENEGATATLNQLIDVGKEILPGLVAVINNHIQSNTPVILEGDFILPELCASFPRAIVQSVFVHESDEKQILLNYQCREPDEGLQYYRANVSYQYGNWLVDGCTRYGIPVIESRPWDTVQKRVIETIT